MPLLNIPAEVTAMIAAGSYEMQSSLDIMLGTGEVLHLSTDALTDVDTIDFGVIDYVHSLRKVGTMSQSITLSADRVDFDAQNVDDELGALVLGEAEGLDGADAILSYVFINDAGAKFQVEILHGEIVNAVDPADPDMTFQMVSHLSTDGALGGFRTLQNHCFNRYKIDPRCASESLLAQGCDKTLDGLNGCKTHLAAARIDTPAEADNTSSVTSFLYQIQPLPGTPPAGPTGVIDGGNDFNSYWRKQQELGDYQGRHPVPKYLII